MRWFCSIYMPPCGLLTRLRRDDADDILTDFFYVLHRKIAPPNREPESSLNGGRWCDEIPDIPPGRGFGRAAQQPRIINARLEVTPQRGFKPVIDKLTAAAAGPNGPATSSDDPGRTSDVRLNSDRQCACTLEPEGGDSYGNRNVNGQTVSWKDREHSSSVPDRESLHR